MNATDVQVLPAASPCPVQAERSPETGSDQIQNQNSKFKNEFLDPSPPSSSLCSQSQSSSNPAASPCSVQPECFPEPNSDQIKIQNSKFKNESGPLHRKIAKLPRPLRDLINSMLEEGMPARHIIAKLEASTDPPLPYPISEMNISDWRNTGYRRHLVQQERLALVQANREGAGDIIATDELTTLPEATLQIVANQFYDLLGNFSPETLRQKLSEDPLKYMRFLNVFARLVREIVHLRKFRDASVFLDATIIAVSWLASSRRSSSLDFGIKPLSTIISIQKILSSASSSAIPSLLMKSAFDRARHAAR